MLNFIKGDITKVKAEAIVNAANAKLRQGGGVCGAIFKTAGARELSAECGATVHCEPGSAVMTGGYALSKYIIHAVGPIWKGGKQGEEELLKSCYKSALELALQNGIKSIAFPIISAGHYGFPAEEAYAVAVSEILKFIHEHRLSSREFEISLVTFNRRVHEIIGVVDWEQNP